jgi:hypothetical protein
VKVPLKQRAVGVFVVVLAYMLSMVLMTIYQARNLQFVRDSRYYQAEQA